MSAIDPDARFGWKSSTKSFFGYKEHIAMTEEEIITAIEVTGGSSDDGKQLPNLLKNTQATGVQVEEVLADTAYSGSTNLKLLQVQNITATIPLNPSFYSSRNPEEGFVYVRDADAVQCPVGYLSVRKARQGKKDVGKNQVLVYYFDVEKCKTCPLRDGFYHPGANTKTYSIRLISKHHEQQMKYEQTTLFQL